MPDTRTATLFIHSVFQKNGRNVVLATLPGDGFGICEAKRLQAAQLNAVEIITCRAGGDVETVEGAVDAQLYLGGAIANPGIAASKGKVGATHGDTAEQQ